MKVGILGSGFGLYGYMPALLGMGHTPFMPLRYREKLLARPELSDFDSHVHWVASATQVLQQSDTLIVALRPASQIEFVRKALHFSNIDRFLLEKPLACSPIQAAGLLSDLTAHAKRVRVGFNFRFTSWAVDFKKSLQSMDANGEIYIDWFFKAHHFANDLDVWKRYASQGGGVLGFYGIHLLAFLAECGYSEVQDSRLIGSQRDQPQYWRATLSGQGLPRCIVTVDTNSEQKIFHLNSSKESKSALLNIRLSDPFDQLTSIGALDRRVELLKQVCATLLDDGPLVPAWVGRSVSLWSACEAYVKE